MPSTFNKIKELNTQIKGLMYHHAILENYKYKLEKATRLIDDTIKDLKENF